MSGNKLLVDTNILIYLLEGNEELKRMLDDFNLYVSFISEIEILANGNLKAEDRGAVKALLEGVYIIDINEEIKDFCIDNRIKFGLKIPDSFVLATAQWMQLPLLTSDREFEKAKNNTAEVIIY